ncbi:hypothetical protein GCM10011316_14190 [Roseibium aquae]|uniref:Uncharacterized protein n=1 Tax=Roseibium aquae TaxID=1323746 RepID=A0A916WYC4_9HYPH|nr:hypothetical protein GCM10011316_14190 [Roseibium aquae]
MSAAFKTPFKALDLVADTQLELLQRPNVKQVGSGALLFPLKAGFEAGMPGLQRF